MLQLKSELEASAKSHTDLAGVLRQQEALLADFVQKRDQARKTVRAVSALHSVSRIVALARPGADIPGSIPTTATSECREVVEDAPQPAAARSEGAPFAFVA